MREDEEAIIEAICTSQGSRQEMISPYLLEWLLPQEGHGLTLEALRLFSDLSPVTGNEVDDEGLHRIGARVFNLQRAILAREGHRGREGDTLPEYEYARPLRTGFGNPQFLVPGKNGEVITRKGEVVDRERFERMKDEYYQLRGWDVATGLQTRASLEELDLQDVAEELVKRGLTV